MASQAHDPRVKPTAAPTDGLAATGGSMLAAILGDPADEPAHSALVATKVDKTAGA